MSNFYIGRNDVYRWADGRWFIWSGGRWLYSASGSSTEYPERGYEGVPCNDFESLQATLRNSSNPQFYEHVLLLR